MKEKLTIAFFGSSLVSAYWNGAATYYRGIIKMLYQLGYQVTFYEPDAYGRQQNRDMEDPDWARVVVYEANTESLYQCLDEAFKADIVVKASGVGVFDQELEYEVANRRRSGQRVIFWDVDAPATLQRIRSNENDPFLPLIPMYDLVLTYGGGDPVESEYKSIGARDCISIYNAFDPETHHPVAPDVRYQCDLAFLGNRLPDRERRVEQFFIEVAASLPKRKFILGGSGWQNKTMPQNIEYVGHVPTNAHNAFNCSPRAVLNISRDSMASYGFSPATRVFEAAGAGACVITDAWKGIENFLTPDEEVLVAHDTQDVIRILKSLDDRRSKTIGVAARERMLSRHTYENRAHQLEKIFSAIFQEADLLEDLKID